MQLSLRLLRSRLSLSWLGGFGGRVMLLYIGYTAALFVIFLLITFPHELLIRRVLGSVNRGPVTIEFSSASFAWIKGYELSGMRIGSNKDGQAPFLECSHFWVRPALIALMHGNPYAVQMNADLYGGSAQGDFSMAGGTLVGNLQLHDLNIGRYRALTSLFEEGGLAGRISGELNFETRGGNLNSGQAGGELRLDGGSLTGAKLQGFGSVPDFHFRQAKLKFAVHGGRLEVQEFKASGDVNVDASGQVAMREPLPESQLNLKVTLETSLATPDPIKTLVALIPRPPGSKPDAPLTISGTFAKPRVR